MSDKVKVLCSACKCELNKGAIKCHTCGTYQKKWRNLLEQSIIAVSLTATIIGTALSVFSAQKARVEAETAKSASTTANNALSQARKLEGRLRKMSNEVGRLQHSAEKTRENIENLIAIGGGSAHKNGYFDLNNTVRIQWGQFESTGIGKSIEFDPAFGCGTPTLVITITGDVDNQFLGRSVSAEKVTNEGFVPLIAKKNWLGRKNTVRGISCSYLAIGNIPGKQQQSANEQHEKSFRGLTVKTEIQEFSSRHTAQPDNDRNR